MKPYVSVRCYRCDGHGVYGGYNGEPVDCRVCDGGGSLIVYESDRIALYPGGPLRGFWPGQYQHQVARQAAQEGV